MNRLLDFLLGVGVGCILLYVAVYYDIHDPSPKLVEIVCGPK